MYRIEGKHRTSLEFPLDVWRHLSSTIPAGNRQDFIVRAIKEKLTRETKKLLILCGGEGTNFRPLTLTIPKPMLPFGYKPLLERNVLYFRDQGIVNFVFAVGYLSEQIMKYFSDGSNHHVNLSYLIEKKNLGTGGAIKNAKKLLDSTFLVMNGDVIFDQLQIPDLLLFHRQKGGIATMVVNNTNDPSNFNCVSFDDTHKVTKITAKGCRRPTSWVNAGLYVFEPKVLDFIESDQNISLEESVFPALAKEGKLFAYPHTGYWAELTSPLDYEKVTRDVLEGKVS